MQVVGLFIRHYKIYKNINYIPISNGSLFTSYIGDNGVGKSTILEALEMLFNHSNHNDWSINRRAKNEGGIAEPFIVPVFVLNNEQLPENRKEYRVANSKIKELSNYFWETDYKTSTPALNKFYEHRSQLKESFDLEQYSLIVAGRQQRDTKGIFFASFHKYTELFDAVNIPGYEDLDDVKEEEEQNLEGDLQSYFDGVLEHILDQFSYIYIPVETNVPSYSKLETQSMQDLMDKSIQDEIENAIEKKSVDQINENLDKFIKEIESTLDGYIYKGTYKNRLTKKDLVAKTIEAYFAIKILHKDIGPTELPIDQLSSGEKRKALIDLAYSFLMRDEERDKKVILAIDEPESSMHIANSYDQFEKVREVADNGNQVLITTHWYGFIPVLSGGMLHSLTLDDVDEVKFASIPLYNFREHIKHLRRKTKGKLPKNVRLKSRNDLVQAIVSSLQADSPYNWIICEGLSEKIYFEYYFSELIEEVNLRILPVGGAKEVLRIYDYLKAPLRDGQLDIQGKVVCLTDTDSQLVEKKCETIENLFALRILNKDEGKTVLVNVDSNEGAPATEIEDALNPNDFYYTLKEFKDDDKLKEIFSEYEKNTNAPNSKLAIDLRHTDQKKVKAFFDKNGHKVKFANRYVERVEGKTRHKVPEWIEELKDIFQ